MKKLTLVGVLLTALISCESSVTADYDTIKAKKVILIGEDGKEYLLTVKNDSLGTAVLGIEEYKD